MSVASSSKALAYAGHTQTVRVASGREACGLESYLTDSNAKSHFELSMCAGAARMPAKLLQRAVGFCVAHGHLPDAFTWGIKEVACCLLRPTARFSDTR